mmetsp:Transcript_7961/g.18600  ORF Transcript_7961/g.18600 Transcript_7961/m.18600 type:complete len:1142 (-) Transcript_7961:12-3437(-)
MDADRVRSYLQVACAGLGFDIGEVWWMQNENGTTSQAVAAIEDSNANISGAITTKPPKKRFLQLYTSKAYCNQRSKLVQPHENENDEDGSSPELSDSKTGVNDRYAGSSSQQLATLRRSSSEVSLELEREHVLSPRIVEAVTNSTQVVWANCQKSEGLLGRSDVKLQTAIGMPVGVDATGNVWVVVMFSPQNVESSRDAIDYLQYISNSAASTNIPCLLPVVGKAYGEDSEDDSSMDSNNNGGMKTICNGEANSNDNNQQLSLASIKPHSRPNLTRNLADGVMAQFMSFNIKDGVESSAGLHSSSPGGTINDLQCAPKDHFGIPMLPTSCEMATLDDHNAFDEASYGVWSTIMNSERHQAGTGGPAKTSGVRMDINNKSSQRGNMASALAGDQNDMLNVDKMHLIKGRLEEFAHAFLGMSIFDLADAWTLASALPARVTSNDGGTHRQLKCLFSVAATEKNPDINYLRELSGQTYINVGDGAVGKAFSSGYPVWNSVRHLIYDSSREVALTKCKIETAFAVPIFHSPGSVKPVAVLSCYSLLPKESVPFVLNFVQKALRLLWRGLDKVITPHESVGRNLWKDVGPADLGEMAADVEMQNTFIGKKRTLSIGDGLASGDSKRLHEEKRNHERMADNDARDRSLSLATQNSFLSVLTPFGLPSLGDATNETFSFPVNQPPQGKGLSPAPALPNTVQELSPRAISTGIGEDDSQQFVYLDSNNIGHWAVQQAIQSVGDLQPLNGTDQTSVFATQQNGTISASPPPQDTSTLSEHQMAYVNYEQSPVETSHSGPKDDPAVICANIMEFNAMAQMHSQPARPAQGQQFASQQQQLHTPQPMFNQQTLIQPLQAPSETCLPCPVAVETGLAANNFISVSQQLIGDNEKHSGQPPPVWQQQVQRQHPPLPPQHIQSSINMDQMPVLSASQQGPMQPLQSYSGVPNDSFCTDSAVPATMDPSQFALSDRKVCRIQGCNMTAASKRPYCEKHCGNRQCERDGCTKCAQGATRFCIAHGGGRRCTFPGCDKGARDKFFCAAHGGGKRCKHPGGCGKSAVGGSNFCTAHGGGRRCAIAGCDKSAQSGTKFCVKHGGGKKCQFKGCAKVARGRTLFCAAHGGGVRCKLEGCNRVAIGKEQLCRTHGGGSKSRK